MNEKAGSPRKARRANAQAVPAGTARACEDGVTVVELK